MFVIASFFVLFTNWPEEMQAYLDQELEKLHQELEEDGKFRERSKGNMARARADMAPVRVKSIPVDRASQLWESLLAHTGLALCFCNRMKISGFFPTFYMDLCLLVGI
jgi:hypothetical protein